MVDIPPTTGVPDALGSGAYHLGSAPTPQACYSEFIFSDSLGTGSRILATGDDVGYSLHADFTHGWPVGYFQTSTMASPGAVFITPTMGARVWSTELIIIASILSCPSYAFYLVPPRHARILPLTPTSHSREKPSAKPSSLSDRRRSEEEIKRGDYFAKVYLPTEPSVATGASLLVVSVPVQSSCRLTV
ncbi:hypothetical protein EHS25_001875 [Saitozyma podzolica]|uniref:Uncharacterized protein n=1 Tax=Saitozyma podzolica TaxID=1890683 RepID=A0A427YFD1_9TREE|nr:hypothetical protein EHS25_001875 [Saitozyma podzolica]